MNPTESYWRVEAPFTITATDDLNGVASVELWYHYSRNNSTWEPWINFSTDTNGVDGWSWNFTAPEGYGYYEFYTVAADRAGNVEVAPSGADARCVVLFSELLTKEDEDDWLDWIRTIVDIIEMFAEKQYLRRSICYEGLLE